MGRADRKSPKDVAAALRSLVAVGEQRVMADRQVDNTSPHTSAFVIGTSTTKSPDQGRPPVVVFDGQDRTTADTDVSWIFRPIAAVSCAMCLTMLGILLLAMGA